MRAACILAALLVVGCATPQQRLANRVNDARATCLAVGFQDGTQDMATCTMVGVQQAQAAADARNRAVLDASVKLLQQNNRPPQPVTWCNWSAFYQRMVCTQVQ